MMNRSFWNKTAGAKGRTAACAVVAALSAMLLFVVCKEKSDGNPVTPCPSTQVGCPGYVDPNPNCPPTQVGCPGYVDPNPSCPPTQVGCPGYVDPNPSCPPTQAGCPGYVGGKRYCYWAPNSYNDYKESCAEIGASTCVEASCQNEQGCEGSSGVVKTEPNCGIANSLTGITTDSNANRTCKMNGTVIYCQWNTGCYEVNEMYGEPAGGTCQDYAESCYRDGTIYTGVTNVNADNEYGKGVTCNGTAYSK